METLINTLIFDVLMMIAVIYLMVLFFSFVGFLVVVSSRRAPAGARLSKGAVFRDQLRHFSGLIGREAFPILIVCCVILVISLSSTFSQELKAYFAEKVSYENLPVVAAAIDGVAIIWPLISPFLVPVLVGAALLLLLYAVKDSSDARIMATINNGGMKLKREESVYLFFHSLEKGFVKISTKLPAVFTILVIVICTNSLLLSGNTVAKIMAANTRIKELQAIVKNLSRSETVANVKLERVRYVAGKNVPYKLYTIQILSSEGDVVSSQQIELEGNELVIDCININFEYSEVASGEKSNLAYPYRIYSEQIPADQGIQLECMFNEDGIPFTFCLEGNEIYGIKEDAFYSRLGELMDVVRDEKLSREMGIRSTIGNAPRLRMSTGETYYIDVEQTGGISAYKKQF